MTTQTRLVRTLLSAATLLLAACGPTAPTSEPDFEASQLARTRLRNEITAVLDAPVDEVWQLIGDHQQLPTYSAGIREVALHGNCIGPSGGVGCVRTCSFHEGPALDEEVVHLDAPRVLATRALEPNDYGLSNDLTLVTLHALADGRTQFRWRQYYDHADLAQMEAVFDEALLDLGQRLVTRFGGSLQSQS